MEGDPIQSRLGGKVDPFLRVRIVVRPVEEDAVAKGGRLLQIERGAPVEAPLRHEFVTHTREKPSDTQALEESIATVEVPARTLSQDDDVRTGAASNKTILLERLHIGSQLLRVCHRERSRKRKRTEVNFVFRV